MAEITITRKSQETSPEYVTWRTEILAQLALSRLPELTVFKAPVPLGYDFLAVTPRGSCFFILVQGYSSLRLGFDEIEQVPKLGWTVSPDTVQRARSSLSPVFLFVFDADTDHGRFLRLDTLPSPNGNVREMTLQFPVEQTINQDSLERLITELQPPRKN